MQICKQRALLKLTEMMQPVQAGGCGKSTTRVETVM